MLVLIAAALLLFLLINAVTVAAFALDSSSQPGLAIAAALGAALLIVGAISGWCPGGLLAQRAAAVADRETAEGPLGR